MVSFQKTSANIPYATAEILRELLSEGHYQETAYLIQQAQQRAAKTSPLAALLAAAYQICLSCQQHHQDAETYEEAYRQALQREADLKQKLLHILATITAQQTPGAEFTPDTAVEVPLPAARRSQEQTAVRPTAVDGRITIAVQCLGAFKVYQNDRLITEWNGQKSQMIFKFLLLNRHQAVSKDILMATFWPEMPHEAARRNLHQAIYSLRQALRLPQNEMQHIIYEKDAYAFNNALHFWVDFEEMERQAKKGRWLDGAGKHTEAIIAYELAEGLYQGEFLSEDLYEDWTRQHRDHFHALYLNITDTQCRHLLSQKEYTAAIALCQKVIQVDNCHEPAHRYLMECFLALKQRHLAIRQYQMCQEILKTELALAPAEETRQIYQQLSA